MPKLTQKQMEDELLQRVSARDSLDKWLAYREAGFRPAKHHGLILDELQKVESGETTRLMLLLPPGSAKSTYTSVEFPPWFMGRNPTANVIAASHTAELAERFGRKARNIVGSAPFRAVFDVGLSQDSQAAGKWETTRGGEYYAVGVGGSVTGRRADLAVIDDPVKSREAAHSERERETVWQWYTHDFLTRLKPQARQILIMCMTGDTRVLMANGEENDLASIRPGDVVATWESGHLRSSKVLNWINQGPDDVYEIRTISGKLLKANERHPFLICKDGGYEWVRLRDLRPSDKMMRLKERGKESLALLMAAESPLESRDSVSPIMQKTGGLEEFDRLPTITSQYAPHICGTDTELTSDITPNSLQDKEGSAPFAGSLQQKKTQGPEQGCISALTTAMTQMSSEGFSATTATLQSDAPERPTFSNLPQDTSDFIVDEIESITYSGREEVFDIQVERTENFIANGCVASNTRWHEDDLGGRILGRDGHKWRVVKIPMEADSPDDPLGRQIGERLWPDWFTDEMVEDAKKDLQSWNALYQQNPIPADGNFFKREWFIDYDKDDLPSTLSIYISSDFAVTDKGGDFTEFGVWGVDFDGDLWLIDWWRGQSAPDVWINELAGLVLRYKPMILFGEAGPIRRAIEPFMRKRLETLQAYTHIEWLASIHDKPTRARAFQALASMGKVKIPKNRPWLNAVLTQWLQFPSGRQDDAVDVASLIGRGLEFVQSAAPPRRKAREDLYGTATAWMG